MSTQDNDSTLPNNSIEFLVFQVGDIRCGINILQMDGINWVPAITPVYGAPDYVKGLLNLRGQVVTVLDLGKRLGGDACKITQNSRIIIATSDGEHIGLLVDSVAEVIHSEEKEIKPPPENTMESQQVFFRGIITEGDRLIALLNVEEILNIN